jgi:Domain of unknown function (DUF222)/HNH endonuclease
VHVEPVYEARAALIARVHELNRVVSSAQREMLSCLAELERHEAWLDDGAHDMPHWVSMQLGISRWKAERWVAAGAALESLPAIAASFDAAEIGIDKVVKLTRFATPDDEEAPLAWAGEVASGAIRRRGEELRRADRVEVEQIEEDRWLAWRWTDEGRRLLLEAELPAAQGTVVTEALDRLADEIPAMPGEESRMLIGRRRADALAVACASGRHADGDATVVIHVQAETLADDDANARTDDGVVLPMQVAHRFLCNAKVQTVVEAADGSVVGLGRTKREPSAWMVRQLRYRDSSCTFPGCGNRRFTQAHHIRWWSRGGSTDLDNLALVCTFHHRLVHEHKWNLERTRSGAVRWLRPDGVRYRAGPHDPPRSLAA